MPTKHHALYASIAIAIAAAACGPSKPAQEGDGSAATGGTTTAEPGAGGGGSATAPTPDATGAATAAAAATSAPSAPAEGPKDENALVLELTVKGKELDDTSRASIEKEMQALIKKSSKVALTEKGVAKPRHVTATLTAEPVTSDKKGFTVKLGMTGVTTNGKCPLFDLDQKLTMEGGKKDNPADVAELRKAAITAMFEELEKKAPTMKPNANCTPYK
jgi:hypothetical protein